jgi:hypothetical protein
MVASAYTYVSIFGLMVCPHDVRRPGHIEPRQFWVGKACFLDLCLFERRVKRPPAPSASCASRADLSRRLLAVYDQRKREKKREVAFRVVTSLRIGDFQGRPVRQSNPIANFNYAKIKSDAARLNRLVCCAAITYSKSGNRSR